MEFLSKLMRYNCFHRSLKAIAYLIYQALPGVPDALAMDLKLAKGGSARPQALSERDLGFAIALSYTATVATTPHGRFVTLIQA